MEKETYAVGEVIFGLRPDAQKTMSEVSVLRHFCQINREKFVDLQFTLVTSQIYNSNPITCRLIEKKTWLSSLKKAVNREKFDISRDAILVRNQEGHYDFAPHISTNFQASVKHSELSQKRFDMQVEKILTSDFTKNINHQIKKEKEQGLIGTLDSMSLSFSMPNQEKEGMAPTVIYRCDLDELHFSNNDDVVTKEVIDNILMTEIPRELLKPYHIRTIDRSGIIGKEIVLQKYIPVPFPEFKVEDTPKQLILRPYERKWG